MADKEIKQNMEEVRIKEKIIKDFNITYTSNGSGNEWKTGMDITPSMIVSFLKRNIEQAYSLGQSHMKQKAKELIGQHNARIINEYQNKYLGLNGKALFDPIQKVTKQTLSALNNL